MFSFLYLMAALILVITIILHVINITNGPATTLPDDGPHFNIREMEKKNQQNQVWLGCK